MQLQHQLNYIPPCSTVLNNYVNGAFFTPASHQVRCKVMFNKVWVHNEIIGSTVIRSDKWCLPRMNRRPSKRSVWKVAVVTGCNRWRCTSECHLPLPPSLSLSNITGTLSKWECFFREWVASCCSSQTRHSPPLLTPANEPWCARAHRRLTLAQRNNTQVHTGRLVDHHCRALHSKCTFSWRSCTVFPLRMSSLALFCTRQLLLNTVYLHLSAISLDCFFNFYFTSVCFRSEGFLSRFPPTCLSGFLTEEFVYLVIYAVRLSLSAFPLSMSIQR